MYHLERKAKGKITEKEVIQTVQGSIERLVSVDAHPLSANQEVEETNKIPSLVKNVAEQRRLGRAESLSHENKRIDHPPQPAHDAVFRAYFTAVHQPLTGHESPAGW